MTNTLEQQISLSIDRHLAITANAGSGKTRVLVQRYKKILEEVSKKYSKNTLKADPSSIVAITFTRKAASEMLSKIVRAFDEDIVSVKNDKILSQFEKFDKLDKFIHIREGLTYARISTIHSFCSNIIRKYPVEAEIPINFTEVTEADLTRIQKDNILGVMEDWLVSDDIEKRDKAQKLFATLNRKTIETYINSILNQSEIFEHLRIFFNQPLNKIIEDRTCFVLETYLEKLKKIFIVFEDCIDNADLAKAGKRLPETYIYLNDYKNHIRNLFDKGIFDDDAFLIILENLRKISLIIGTTTGTIRKDFVKLLHDNTDIDLISFALSEMGDFNGLSESYKNVDDEANFIEISKILFELALDVFNAIEEDKQILGGLDFNDLQLKTLKVLNNKKVADAVRKKIKYIMIDEFQDTNEIQYEIVKRLVPELTADVLRNDINLFIVGDEKQSIYGFRNADVRVFKKAKEDLSSINNKDIENKRINGNYLLDDGSKYTPTDNELGGIVSLTATFRMLPTISAFVNKVCSAIMDSTTSSYDVNYSPLVCARMTDALADKKVYIPDNNSFLGAVDFLLSIKKSKNNNEEDVTEDDEDMDLSEPTIVAKYIKNIINHKKIQDENSECQTDLRIINFGDIAVISRRKTNFTKLSRVFLDEGIPFILHSGSGFYETSELNDLLSILKFIYNTNDDLSLIAALRSPFFNIKDTELMAFSKFNSNKTLWENIKYLIINNNTDIVLENILSPYLILNDILKQSLSMSVSQSILFIIEVCGFMGIIVDNPRRRQIQANIEKLLEQARNFESVGFRNLYDYVDELNFISAQPSKESEAIILSGQDAVNIMTIHASKGLEFPVVILYDTNSNTVGNKGIVINKDHGFGFPLPKKVENIYNTTVNTPISYLNRSEADIADKAEEKRVLYVAMTRAKDLLAISANLKMGVKDKFIGIGGLFKLIVNGLAIDIDEIYQNNTFKLFDMLKILNKNKIKELEYHFNINSINEDLPDSEINIGKIIKITDKLSLTENPLTIHLPEMFSPSKLMTYRDNPEEYMAKYILSINSGKEIEHEPEKITDENELGISGSEAGTIIHEVLQEIKSWLNVSGTVNAKRLETTVDSILSEYSKRNDYKLSKRVLVECSNIATTQLIQNNRNNLVNAEFEYSLFLPVGEDLLTGKFDIIIKNDNGDLEIWDWKTNKIDTDNHKLELINHYELQMKVYAYLIYKLHPLQKLYTSRLLFTRLAENNSSDDVWTYRFDWSANELKNFEQELKEMIISLRNDIFVWC